MPIERALILHALLVLLALGGILPTCAPGQEDQPVPAAALPQLTSAETIPVHAWVGPPADQTTPERYAELAAAGFTSSFSNFPDADAVARALEVAQGAGVKLLINCPELATDPEAMARRFAAHPALAGYHLRDEPSTADFPALAAQVRRIQAVDDRHWTYINLFPTYASAEQLAAPSYREYVDRFVREVPVANLSFDHYPILGGAVREDFYENLEIVAAAARAAHKPFWAFALAVGHGGYPVPELAHLRLQIHSDLAYGAAGIQYFTYWTPVDPAWNFRLGPIAADGTRTPTYELVKRMNQELRALSGVFVGATVEAVGHLGRLPRGTVAYRAAPPIAAVTADGDGAVVSLLAKGRRRFLVLVNRSLAAALPLTVGLDGSVPVQRVDGDARLQPLAAGAWSATVDPGDIAILTWEREP
jgi:hypothetical protein